MRPNPWQDAASFLTNGSWLLAALWALLVGGALIAFLAWKRYPVQRTPRDVSIGLLRVVVGIMWWQQSLWKVPPDYGGLIHWMNELVKHASTMLQSNIVSGFVLPNIGVFGPLVYAVEASIGASLILGFLTRASGVLGALMAINLWLGLYSAPGEWPWTYVFLTVIQLLFVIDPPGRSLGADALLAHSPRRWVALAA